MAASTRPPPGHGEYRPDADRWKALAVVLAAGFMTLLDVSIVNVALPSIEQGLHARPNELQWIVSGYALALGLLLVPAGRFGDAHGRRPVFMLGVALFVAASAASALAPTAPALVVMRIVQGFAGGLISPQISGLIQSLFGGQERGRAFGYFGTTIGVSTAVGPLIGGALIALFGTHDGWRAVFFVNLPIGAAILLAARRYLPAPTTVERRPQALDALGVILLGAAVVSILVALIEQRTWDSPLRLALYPLAAVLLLAWVRHERRYARTREPLVSPNLTLTLSQVPVARAGSAGGVLQTGQRIGTAAGIAVTGSLFYTQLTATHGDYATAFRHAIISIAAFAAAALALVLADAVTRDS